MQTILGMAAKSASTSQDILDMDITSLPSEVGERLIKEIRHYDTLKLFLISRICKERINPGVRIDKATLSPNNNLIACVGEDKFFLWDRITHKIVQDFQKNNTEYGIKTAFSDDGSYVAICSYRKSSANRRGRIWHVQTGHSPR